MSKKLRIWLWIALLLSISTAFINLSSQRWISVIIALGALAGLCVLLFAQKKWGFYLMCACYVLAFIEGVSQGIAGESSLLISIIMSLIGSLFIPGITYLFLRSEKK